MDSRQHQYQQRKNREAEFPLPLLIPISISHKRPLLYTEYAKSRGIDSF